MNDWQLWHEHHRFLVNRCFLGPELRGEMGVQTLASRWLREFISQHVLLAPQMLPRGCSVDFLVVCMTLIQMLVREAGPTSCPALMMKLPRGVAMSAHHRVPAQPWVVRPLLA